jgi:hypothetical protein
MKISGIKLQLEREQYIRPWNKSGLRRRNNKLASSDQTMIIEGTKNAAEQIKISGTKLRIEKKN